MASKHVWCKAVALTLMATVSAGANAQQFSSFWRMMSISGVTVTPPGSAGPNSYTVSVSNVASNRYVTYLDQFNVLQTAYWTEVIGFFKLSDGTNTLGAAGVDQSVTNGNGTYTWGWYPDQQKVAGWKTGQGGNNARLSGGDSATFTYTSLTNAPWVTNGFHLQFAENQTLWDSGNTFYVSTNVNTNSPGGNSVPEPFTMGLVLAGVGAFVRKRMKGSS